VEDVASGAAAELAELTVRVREADRALARAVELAGRLAGTGVCEAVEGLPLEHFVGLAGRLTGGDARMLVSAGETLATMPATGALFADGTLSWGQVRAIVAGCRRLRLEQRREVDERLAATAAAYRQGVESYDPDGLVWAVRDAIDELEPARAERAERRQIERTFLARQMDFDGGMRCYGEFDPVAAAVVNNAIDAKMGSRPPAGAGDPDRDEHETVEVDALPASGDDAEASAHAGGWGAGWSDRENGVQGAQPGTPPAVSGESRAGAWTSTATGRAAAEALVGMCADWLGGDTRRPARPLVVAHVDLSQVTAHPSGTVELNLRGPLPRIGAATLDRLARDADLRAVLFDGKRPLAASRKINLDDIPARTRFAVETRDLGCRFPGSQAPIGFTDLDHIHAREHGGNHDPDNLVAFSRRPHRWRHKYDWTIALEPRTAMITITRKGRRFHSLPRGTPLARPREREPADAAGVGSHRDPPGQPPWGAQPGDPPVPF
jgi:hypothetical protein